jgi:hypothetical protein
MEFINKKDFLKTLSINSYEKSILYNKDQSSIDNTQFIQKLFLLKENYWITCHCSKDALLIICLLNGNIYIRCKTLEIHKKTCFFRYNKNVCITQKTTNRFNRIKQYNIYKNASNILDNAKQERSYNKELFSLSRLGQVLYTIIEDAGLNIIKPNAESKIFDQLSAITNTFNDPKKFITKKIALGKYYRYILKHDTLEKSESYLKNATSWFPKSVKPFILFSSISSRITNNSFIIDKEPNNPFYVKNTISLPSNWINKEKSSPYFILTSALLDENCKVYLNDAFAMPIFHKQSLMPIESNYERTVLKIILSTCKNFKDIKIEKPLFDIIEKEFRFRPDFIIHYKNKKKIFIEVLGSLDNEYLNHKNTIAFKAKRYCHEYISIKAFNLNKEYEPFVHKLKKAIAFHFTSDNYVF